MENSHPEESDRLLFDNQDSYTSYRSLNQRGVDDDSEEEPDRKQYSPYRILPVSLLASLAMSVTVATTVYAYQSLTCRDPAHCTEKERRSYAGSVAIANSIAHLVGVVVIGPLQALVKKSERRAMIFWILSRALSVGALPAAVFFQNIGIALTGRIFEGAASDNSLHFILNSVYARSAPNATSRLMGTSLALFMVGMALGPIFAGVFSDYQVSFAIGGVILLVAGAYIAVFVPGPKELHPPHVAKPSDAQRQPASAAAGSVASIRWALQTLISPLVLYYHRPSAMLLGASMFLFTAVQSYLFQAIIIHASIVFGFGSTQNGWIVSVAAAMSAFYLFIILWLLPKLGEACWRRRGTRSTGPSTQGTDSRETPSSGYFDVSMFAICVSVQSVASISMAWWTTPGPFLAAVAISALGLGAGSFLKSWFARKNADGAEAMAALSIMETVGGLASPVILGSWQALHSSDGSTFILVSALLAGSVIFFLTGTAVL